MSNSESTPLLSNADPEAVYSRFSPARKVLIVSFVSCSSLLPMFASGSFIPSIQQIAADLETTGQVVSYAVGLSMFGTALSSFFFATYSSFYGRRPMFLAGLPLLCAGSVGVATASTVPQLMIFRLIQALGTSGGGAVGAGVISDIYKVTERGTALGVFSSVNILFAAALMGNILAPLIGGWGAKYASWRIVQLGLFVTGLVIFCAVYFLMPETAHPGTRGVDKLLSRDRNSDGEDSERRRTPIVWLNPFGCLWLLRSPNVLFVMMSGGLALLADYAILVPIAYTLGARYNITNEAVLGALFIPKGLGNMIGAPLAGRLSDHILVRRREEHGTFMPEDRLRACAPGGLFLVPLSMLFCGLTVHFVPGPVGLALALVFFFTNGLGVVAMQGPASAYLIDILRSRSAEVMAVTVGTRALLLSLPVSGLVPAVIHFGVLPTYVGVAVLAWIGYGMIWATLKYGGKMREWADVGFEESATR
ncbi:hypothetical protein HMN09_00390300 [Mycena chlorophos]|uniref:Major facilitator superfamily (MFS) profile domain-containing protein n=1 Tax=Mycena chlorophos TaxID=658473 RepID=A0A8H6TJP3_MYCCL|nr:hypothetical protein HMN09_00390300 [Mycena chlorophos]